MAHTPRKIEPDLHPPYIPETILTWLTPSIYKDELLGDLAEGYAQKLQSSKESASSWYWQQAVKSAPILVVNQLTSERLKTIFLIMAGTVLTILMVELWDMYVARRSAQYLATQSIAPPLIVTRAVYFIVQAVGFAFTGGIVAKLIFRRRWQFGRNVVCCIGPFILILLTTATIAAVASEQIVYFSVRITVVIAALIGGAYLHEQFRRRM